MRLEPRSPRVHYHPDGISQGDFKWSFPYVAGRLAEISGSGDTAVLTVACALVRDAQRRSEPVAWINRPESTFYPPDVAVTGVDLDALIVIRDNDSRSTMRSADHLLRSGGFGLVIVDLGRGPHIPLPVLARLSGLARRHRAALVFLTEKTSATASLGPLISIAATASRQRIASDRFRCWLHVVKDKHGAPTRGESVDCFGPDGLHCHP